ncbi:hypothetical protein VNI00_010508 [Paramarasmius palmivorus]|uniref:Glucose receptor Git3 N-terminal domain-containing protein n=1 Tax=Paramarasmius palmivorus TaxID=297713 RepID=A0AAW0CLC2_9AGAR
MSNTVTVIGSATATAIAAGNDLWYLTWERSGVICLAVAGLLSIASVLFVLRYVFGTPKTFRTHIFEYLVSLFIANVVQSTGTAMNLRWVVKNGVSNGSFCVAQGAIKQAGNVATALWSFMISLHLFNILFMRSSVTRVGLWLTLLGGWLCVAVIVFIGPAAVENPEKGPYFGISGRWCWITNEYPEEQIFLEYFFEFLSACLSFILYCVILLRVRGNLVHNQGKWQLKFISSSESWRLGFARDLIDSSMLKLAQKMVWFPVAYTIILIPITITRLSEFMGHKIPFGATVFAGVVFNLTGFVNVCLIVVTRRVFPDIGSLPEFNTPRNKESAVVFGKSGITPFTQQQSESAASYHREREARQASYRERMREAGERVARQPSVSSTVSQSSTAELIPK